VNGEDQERNELASLLELIGQGSEGAFKELYERTSSRLFAFCLRMHGDRGEAEEVLQDALVRIWKYAPKYCAEKSAPMTWMLMLCRSAGMDRLRRGRADSRQFSSGGEQLTEAVDEREVEGDEVDEAELVESVQRSIAALPDAQRRVIELAFYEGFTQSEIALRERRPLGSVKSDIRRALMRLRKRFGPNA